MCIRDSGFLTTPALTRLLRGPLEAAGLGAGSAVTVASVPDVAQLEIQIGQQRWRITLL